VRLRRPGRGTGSDICGRGTPRDTLRKLQKVAAVDANKADFVQCFRCSSEGERRLAENQFDFVLAIYELYDALVSSYGKDAVSEFREAKSANGWTENYGVFPRDTDWVADAQIVPDGDKASVTWTLDIGSEQTMMMLREDGVWRIDMRASLGGVDAGQMAPIYKAWEQAIRRALNVVGKEGIGPADVKLELTKKKS